MFATAIRRTLACFSLLLIGTPAFAQGNDDSIGHRYYSNVQFNLYDRTITGYLPFDVPFILSGPLPNAVNKIEILYVPREDVSIFLLSNKTVIKSDTLQFRNRFSTAWRCFWHSFRKKKKLPNRISTTINAKVNQDRQAAQSVKDETNKDPVFWDTSDIRFYTYYENIPDNYWLYSKWERSPIALKTTASADTFNIYMQPLKGNREYLFFVRITYGLSSDTAEKKEVVSLLKQITTPVVQQTYEQTKNKEKQFSDSSFVIKNSVANSRQKNIVLMTASKGPEEDNELVLRGKYRVVTDYLAYSFKTRYGIDIDTSQVTKKITSIFKDDDYRKIVTLNVDYFGLADSTEAFSRRLQLGNTDALQAALKKAGFSEDLAQLNKLRLFQRPFSMKEPLLLGRADFSSQTEYLPAYRDIVNAEAYDKYLVNIDKLMQEFDKFVATSTGRWTTENSLEAVDPGKAEQYTAEISRRTKQMDELKKDAEKHKQQISALQKEIDDLKEKQSDSEEQALMQIMGLYDTLNTFVAHIKYGIRYNVIDLQAKLREIDAFWTVMTNKMAITLEQTSGIDNSFQNTTSNTFMTRAEYYISGDMGIAALFFGQPNTSSFGLKTFQPYFGVNFNVCPINRQAHYGLFASSLSKNKQYVHPVLRSFSFVTGVTFNQVKIDTKTGSSNIDGLWSLGGTDVMLLTGGAIRLTDYIRFSVGTSWYRYRYSTNPLETKQWRLAAGLYFSVSLDLDVRKYTRYVGQVIFNDSKIKNP